jgi:hypothetical protein
MQSPETSQKEQPTTKQPQKLLPRNQSTQNASQGASEHFPVELGSLIYFSVEFFKII